MGIEQFLRIISEKFDLESAKRITSSLHQDQLIWKSLANAELRSSFATYAADIKEIWTVGHLVRHVLINNNYPDINYPDLNNGLSEFERHKVFENYQTTKKTLLPPVDLFEVGLLALYLREYRITNKNWKGVNEIFTPFIDKIKVWPTVFAALPEFIPDVESFYLEFLAFKTKKSENEKISSVVHALLCNPVTDSDLLNLFHNIFAHVDLDLQISSLFCLNRFGRSSLTKLLAEDYLKLQGNLSTFSNVLAKFKFDASAEKYQHEMLDEGSVFEIDILQKLAALYHYAEKHNFSSEILALVNKLLIQNQGKILNLSAKELANFSPDQAIAKWESALKLLPNDNDINLSYSDFLIETGNWDRLKELSLRNPLTVKSKLLTKQVIDFPYDDTLTHDNEAMLEPIIDQQANQYSQNSWDSSLFDESIQTAKYYKSIKSIRKAQKFVNQALDLRPNDVYSLKLAAELHIQNAELNEATEKYALIKSLEPSVEQNHINLVDALIRQRQYQKAFEIFDALFSSYPDPSRIQLLKYADLAEKAGKTDIAIPICKKLLSYDPLDGEALITLGNSYINSNQENLAIEIMEKAAAIAPEKPESWVALAKLWSRLGARDRVLDSLQKAKIALPAEPIILTDLGKAYLENELVADALPLLKEANQLSPESIEIKINLADALHKLGLIQDAWQVLEDLEDEYTSDPKLACLLGQLRYQMSDFHKAHQYLQFAWRSSPSEEITFSYSQLLLNFKEKEVPSEADIENINSELSEILYSLQDEIDGEISFEKSLLLADIKNALGQHKCAHDEYINLLSDPASKSPRIYSQLQFKIGKSSLDLKLNEEGLAALQEAVITEPTNYQFRRALAEAYLRFDLIEDAKSSARVALQISPHELDNILWYSNFMLANGETQKAIASLKDAIIQSPNNRELYISLSRLYISINDYVSAKSILNDMINLEDISIHEMSNAASIFFHLNDIDKASSLIQKAISSNGQKSFWDLDEIIRMLLLIGEFETAKELVIENEVIFGSLPEFLILKSDVLIASNLPADALANLYPLLDKLSYSPNLLDGKSEVIIKNKAQCDNYSLISTYLRAIQLERFFGNYLKVKELIESAERVDLSNPELKLVKLEVAFSLHEQQIFSNIFQNIKPPNNLIIGLNCIKAIINNDYATAENQFDMYLSNSEPSLMTLAIQACLEYHYNEIDLAQNHFDEAIEEITSTKNKNSPKIFNIEAIFIELWTQFALAIAAWKMEKWEMAGHLFEQASTHVNINPYLNFVHANFRVDLVHHYRNAEKLKVVAHKPSLEIIELASQIFREQIIYAKHYLPESIITSSQKIADIVFTCQIPEKNELMKLIGNEDIAALILGVIDMPELIKEITSAFPKSPVVQFQHALISMIDNPRQSQSIIENLVLVTPRNPKLLALGGLNQILNSEQRIAYFEKALAIWPDEPEWHAIIAEQYTKIGLNSEAEKHLEKAIMLNPHAYGYFQLLGEIKKKDNDLSESKTLFSQAYNLFPENTEVLQELASINRKLGKNDDAIECLHQLIKLDPNNTTHQVKLADTYLAGKNYDKALETAKNIRVNVKDEIQAREIEIKALIGKKNSEEVKRLTENAILEFPDYLPFRLLEVETTRMISGNDAALKKANSLVQEFPEEPSVILALANSQLDSGQLNNAALTFHRILEILPDQPETLTKLGRINRINGNLDQAIDLLSHAIEIDMTNMDAYIELGKTYQNRRQHEKAIEIYNKAISVVDNDYRLYFQAGIAYKECKDYRQAETMLRTAATLAPMETSIRRQLASVITLNLVNTLQEAPNRYEH